jgi:hypothetical protein
MLRYAKHFDAAGIAFTSVPENFDVEKLILVRHQHLFDNGLDETYFDHTVEIFVQTLQELEVDPEVIEESKEVISPLRKYFEEGAQLARERRQKERQQQAVRQMTLAAVMMAAITVFAMRAIQARKK